MPRLPIRRPPGLRRGSPGLPGTHHTLLLLPHRFRHHQGIQLTQFWTDTVYDVPLLIPTPQLHINLTRGDLRKKLHSARGGKDYCDTCNRSIAS